MDIGGFACVEFTLLFSVMFTVLMLQIIPVHIKLLILMLPAVFVLVS